MSGPIGGPSQAVIDRMTLYAKAGGDLVMPGSKGDFDSIVKAAKSGELELKQLQINATRVVRKAEELHI